MIFQQQEIPFEQVSVFRLDATPSIPNQNEKSTSDDDMNIAWHFAAIVDRLRIY